MERFRELDSNLSKTTFLDKVNKGYYAGDTKIPANTDTKSNTAGIDCSGFVGTAYGVDIGGTSAIYGNIQKGTKTFFENTKNGYVLAQGDVGLTDGHTFIFDSIDAGGLNVLHSVNGGGGTKKGTITFDTLALSYFNRAWDLGGSKQKRFYYPLKYKGVSVNFKVKNCPADTKKNQFCGVAGDFSDWDVVKDPLKLDEDAKTKNLWSGKMGFVPGKSVEFKFFVGEVKNGKYQVVTWEKLTTLNGKTNRVLTSAEGTFEYTFSKR